MRIPKLYIAVFIHGFSTLGFSQGVEFNEYVCPSESFTVYEDLAARSGDSDRICDSGTRYTYELSGDTHLIQSLNLIRMGPENEGTNWARLEISWMSNVTGTVIIKINFERRKKKNPWDCDWEPITPLSTYTIIKESINPGGQLQGTSVSYSNGSETKNISLGFIKNTSSLTDTKAVRYWINGSYAGERTVTETSTTLTAYRTGFGDYTYTTQVKNSCNEWFQGPSKVVSIVPSCKQDLPSGVSINIPGGIQRPGSVELFNGQSYTITNSGITDFDAHYNLSHDGGSDLYFTGSNGLSVRTDIGSYTVRTVKKSGRESCPTIPDLKVFVGGSDIELERFCDITVPDDLPDFGINLDPDDIVFEHFALTVSSDRNIIIKPGITLTSGAELFLEPGTPLPTTDLDKNFIETRSYNEYGELQSAGRAYFDGMGRPTQSQYQNLDKNIILGSEVLYDAQGRAVISTANAPIWKALNPSDDGCITQLPGNNLVFEYKENFVTSSGEKYDRTHFDEFMVGEDEFTKELSPDGVDNLQEGTLGWYYSANNGSSSEPAFNEPLVDNTSYPYSRTLFHHDGTEDPKGQTVPGDVYVAGSGILAESNKESVTDTDEHLTAYSEIVRDELGLAFPTAFEGDFNKVIGADANGKRSVTYLDREGKTLINLFYGTLSSPITKSYQFYDEVGRVIESVTPNGVAAYEAGTPFATIDKTQYVYNGRGLLSDLYETDGGHTRYIYRADGSIRFSQNQEQRENGRYSYTHYDASERPFKSGEYLPEAGGITFGSPEMTNPLVLESIALDGGLSDALGQHLDEIETLFDLPDPLCPYPQKFVKGRISRISKAGVSTTWYSYDYLGRAVWTVQNIIGFRNVKISYSYGPDGQVTEVNYQDESADSHAFSHFYEYNADAALVKVSTKSDVTGGAYETTTNASYSYYTHGPLKRLELGDKLQGIDYIYTTDGKLKSINDGGLNNDPGGDDPTTNGFTTDYFGQTLSYHTGDYTNSNHTPYDFLSSVHDNQYNGNIKGQTWHNPTWFQDTPKGYGYTYDERDQLVKSDFAHHSFLRPTFSENPSSWYDVYTGQYDLNGNIGSVVRHDYVFNPLNDFAYHYETNSNRLDNLTRSTTVVRDFEYNDIGQLELDLDSDSGVGKKMDYDVTGKVTAVYPVDIDTRVPATDPLVEYVYDEKGFRLLKLLHDEAGILVSKTWYVRDDGGKVMAIYEEDIVGGTPAQPIELPIYGTSRIGVFKPQRSAIFYELHDHLGNVRTVIGDPVPITFTASMEIISSFEEESYFAQLPETRTIVPDFINHTATVNADQAIRLNNVQAGEEQSIGPSITLEVNPGDTIRSEVFVKYFDPGESQDPAVSAFALLLPAFTGTSGLGDPGAISNTSSTGAYPIPLVGGSVEDAPRAYLNYILFDHEMNMLDAGYQRVSTAAEIPSMNPHLHTHEQLAEEVVVQNHGYITLYVSNSSVEEAEVFFDDFAVQLTSTEVVRAHDYYPFGSRITDFGNIDDEEYRYGYQGEYSEEDKETEWNSFESRMYDPLIGKFTTVDPQNQFASPYLGMGNNPVNGVDPDGEYFFGLFGSTAQQRRDARNLASIKGGEVLNMHSRDISVAWQTEIPTPQGGDFFRVDEHVFVGKDFNLSEHVSYSEGVMFNALQGDLNSVAILQDAGLKTLAFNLHLQGMRERSGAAYMQFGLAVATAPLGFLGRAPSLTAGSVFTKGPSGAYYSVAFEMQLPANLVRATRYAHFKAGNAALQTAMKSNPLLSKLGISAPKFGSPSGWVWHHSTSRGVLQLVPKAQHPSIPGGMWWQTMHPGGIGGYAIWGR
ncbi:MAG: RHS repeat-associated core domain-containing protein [Bacteroidota bacterium]